METTHKLIFVVVGQYINTNSCWNSDAFINKEDADERARLLEKHSQDINYFVEPLTLYG